jgi:radical SAM protein with 4Fe4S-binding SPASM domain
MEKVLSSIREPLQTAWPVNNTKRLYPQFPDRVTVELTNNCNLKCTMCPRVYMKSSTGYMSTSLFKKVIDEISMYRDIALVPFFRGESLLHPEFIEMMKYAKQKRICPIQFTTNASKLTEDIAQALIGMELDFISFSVDSIDQDTYGNIRKGAELQDVMGNIEKFSEIKRKKGQDKPEIQVSVVKTEGTIDSIDEFVDFWQGRVDRVRVYKEHSKNGNFGSLSKNHDVITSEERQPCLKPFSDFIIYWDGSVALCNHDWDRRDAIGNVNHNSIKEIWQNGKYKKIRDAHIKNNNKLEELCKRCDHWKSYYLEQHQIGELYAGNSKTTTATIL